MNRISVSTPYIFCYFIGDKDFEWKALETIKKQYGINRVIVFSVAPPTCKIVGYEYLQSADIYDFVWFLHHATYVVTDSFHNVAMSLKLKKDFVALMRCKEDQKSENSRMYDFLASFGLEFKIYNPNNTDYLSPIPYERVLPQLEARIKECTNELIDNLNE